MNVNNVMIEIKHFNEYCITQINMQVFKCLFEMFPNKF